MVQEGRTGWHMERKFWIKIVFFLLVFNSFAGSDTPSIPISPGEAGKIAEKVFENECSGKDECLMAWNEGEEFLSLGIGHFIWYPDGKTGPFEESFPEYIKYLRSKKAKMPKWLDVDSTPKCPWNSREDFFRDLESRKARDLQQFLLETKIEQGNFIVQRFDRALPLMLRKSSLLKRGRIRKQYNRMASLMAGIFAMVDYINFKGMGIATNERYKGKGWGLLQVLSGMNGEDTGIQALVEFVQVADKVLVERVKNAPKNRKEERWLPGWQKRVRSYLEF